MEQDEAGRLRAFRRRFGRGWDQDAVEGEEGEEAGTDGKGAETAEDSLMDLISGAAGGNAAPVESSKPQAAADAGKEVRMVKILQDGKLVSVPALGRSEKRKL